MIENIHIKNFRKIKNLTIEGCGQVNLILGQNNCGKTSLLETIFLILGPTNPQLSHAIEGFRNLIINHPNDLSFLFHKQNFDEIRKICTTFSGNETRTLSINSKFDPSFTIPFPPKILSN